MTAWLCVFLVILFLCLWQSFWWIAMDRMFQAITEASVERKRKQLESELLDKKL